MLEGVELFLDVLWACRTAPIAQVPSITLSSYCCARFSAASGMRGVVWEIWGSGDLSAQSPAQCGITYPGLSWAPRTMSSGSWMSPRMETPPPIWAGCASVGSGQFGVWPLICGALLQLLAAAGSEEQQGQPGAVPISVQWGAQSSCMLTIGTRAGDTLEPRNHRVS